MSFDLRKIRKAHFLALAILVFGAACQDSLTDPAPTAPRPNLGLAADSSGEFYYYQGAKVFLDVDPSRMVVSGPTPDGATASLRGIGLTIERAERLQQAPNHWVIRLSGTTTAVQAAAARTLLKADNRYRFVSNVYKTRGGGDDVIPLNRVIVQFKKGVSSAQSDSLIFALGLTVVRPPRPDSGFTYEVLEYPRDSVSSLRVAALLDRNPLVQWADPDKVSNRHPDFVPSDSYYPLQYYLKNTVVKNGVTVDDNVESAWDLTVGQWSPASGGLRVGVVGSGIDASHPEFDGRIVSAYDALQCYPGCSDDATHPYPGDNHETLVTGIIVGQHNGVGIAGIAPGVYIASGRIFRGAAVASDQGIADVINYMWQLASAQVISNSWGGGAPSNAITSAIVAANSQGRGGRGTVVVFSAGNTSRRDIDSVGPVHYPATLPEVIAVGAINRYGDLTDYSPEGPELDIVAPSGHYTDRCIGDVTTTDLMNGTGCNDGPNGDNIYSTTFSGTSAAAPQVAAVVALIISRNSGLTSGLIKNKLLLTAVSWGPGYQYGHGKLNAFRAISNVDVTVSGLTTIKREGGYTWTASATGGNGSYTYGWERSEAGGPYYPVGTGTSYSEYFDTNSPMYIDLRVTATSGAETGQVVKRVNNLIVP